MSPSINNGSSFLVILISFVLFLTSPTFAFNITKLLDRYPGYGTFNNLLSQTKLANEINRRQTITVLAIPDEQISGLASKGIDTAKRVLSNHVILDYYDMEKLRNLKKGTAELVTLYQSSGVASDQSGFLNVTDTKDGQVKFGSAAKGAAHDVSLIKLVAAQPYNISVLEVSGPIVTPGVDAGPAGPPLKPVAPPPTAHKKKPSPPPAAAESPEESEASSPADGPAESPSDAPAPTPADTPTDAPTSGPTADGEPEEDAAAPNKATIQKGFAVSFSIGMMVSLVALFLVEQ